MEPNLTHELAALRRLTPAALRTRYVELFGETARTANKGWLVKRIAWRLQAIAEGDLSERARQRAAQLANDADLRLSPPQLKPATAPINEISLASGLSASAQVSMQPDRRLPQPGAVIHRLYKGQELQVTVLQSGFAYGAQVFASLSAVAKAITGSHCNGYLFFRLTKTEATP